MEDQVKSETDDGASPSISTTGTAAAGDLMENILENRKDPIEVDQNINSEPDVTNSQDESVQGH